MMQKTDIIDNIIDELRDVQNYNELLEIEEDQMLQEVCYFLQKQITNIKHGLVDILERHGITESVKELNQKLI